MNCKVPSFKWEEFTAYGGGVVDSASDCMDLMPKLKAAKQF